MAALTVRVCLLSGRECSVSAAADWTVTQLRRAAEKELGGERPRALRAFFWFLFRVRGFFLKGIGGVVLGFCRFWGFGAFVKGFGLWCLKGSGSF